MKEMFDEASYLGAAEQRTYERRAKNALRLLGLIERHGWEVWPSLGAPPWVIESAKCLHRAPTLIEALQAAAACERCTGEADTNTRRTT